MRKSGASHGAGENAARRRRHQLLAGLRRHALHPAPGGDLPHVAVHAHQLFHHHADERQGHHAVPAEPPALRADRASRARALQEAVGRGQPLRAASDAGRQGQGERAAHRPARRSERQDRGRRGQVQRARAANSTSRSRSPTRHSPRSRSSISSSPRSGFSSPRSRRRSMRRRPRTRRARSRSPISASG